MIKIDFFRIENGNKSQHNETQNMENFIETKTVPYITIKVYYIGMENWRCN